MKIVIISAYDWSNIEQEARTAGANAFAEDVHAAKTAGMNEHIAKSLDISTLAKMLKKWIHANQSSVYFFDRPGFG